MDKQRVFLVRIVQVVGVDILIDSVSTAGCWFG